MKLNPLLVGLLLSISLGGCMGSTATVGAKAPDAELERLDTPGKMEKISEKKAVRVIDFWATWCGPCRESMPFIEKVYNSYKDKGVEVMGVTNENRLTVEKFHQSSGYTYPIYLDSFGDANRRYNIQAIPTLVVIDKNDEVRFVGSPFEADKVTQAIDAALKN